MADEVSRAILQERTTTRNTHVLKSSEPQTLLARTRAWMIEVTKGHAGALAVVGFVPITKTARGTCVDPTRRIKGAALVDFVRRIGNREALLLLVITPVSHRGTTL